MYYLLGDNAADSVDSRCWDEPFVRKDDILDDYFNEDEVDSYKERGVQQEEKYKKAELIFSERSYEIKAVRPVAPIDGNMLFYTFQCMQKRMGDRRVQR